MRYTRLVFVCLVATLLLIAACKSETTTSDTAATTATTATTGTPAAAAAASIPKPPECPPAGETCPGSACPDSITTAQATMPATACPREGEFQSDVDTFSWNEFIALNWPADVSTCAPNTSKSILNVQSGDGTVAVWQTYMPASSVFLAGGAQPAAWCSGNGLTNGSRPLDDVAKAEPHFAKLGAAFAQISEPTDDLQAAGGVLTDQSGRWVRYEKLMNQDEYNYTIQTKLYSKAGQLAFKNAGNTAINLPTGPTGAVEIKASWKVLTDAEIAGKKYFTQVATVYNTPGNAPSPGKNPVTLGLVGLHIIHKTPQQTGFFWSTFEHADNDTVFAGGSGGPNQQTASKPYVELNPDGSPHNKPVNVQRLHSDYIDNEINAYYRALLAGSVFANYRLISTQWQTGGAPQGTPPFVANITMETYVQNLQVGKASGCLACHTTTPTAVPGLAGDHSFLFAEAQ